LRSADGTLAEVPRNVTANMIGAELSFGWRGCHEAGPKTTYIPNEILSHFPLKKTVVNFLLLVFAPIAASAARYFWLGDCRGNWQTEDRSSAGLLLPATEHADALIRIFAARMVRWRSIFAVHTWIVVKEKGASRYSRYDYTAWGEPIRSNGFAPDGRWSGAMPETVVAVIGERADALIRKIRYVVENYKFRTYGDYSVWPGPNSNTFVQAALDSVPELTAVLPPTAIGKDFHHNGRWIRITRHGCLRLARRIRRCDGRLGRRLRTQLLRCRSRARYQATGVEASGARTLWGRGRPVIFGRRPMSTRRRLI
jgi:hypothetical protein